MYCRYCGSAISESAQFCGACGKRQNTTQGPTGGAVGKPAPRNFPRPRQDGVSGIVKRIVDWMGRHPIWTMVILLFVLGSLFKSVLDESRELGKGPVRETADANAPETTPTEAISAAPFNIRLERLPVGFLGNDIEEVYEQLTAIHSSDAKDEFETTQGFRERLEREKQTPIVGSLTHDSTYAFVIEQPSTVYNADAQVSRVFIDVNPVWVSTYHLNHQEKAITAKRLDRTTAKAAGETAFGVKRAMDVTNDSSYEIAFPKSNIPISKDALGVSDAFTVSLPMRREDAPESTKRVRALVVCKLKPPFISEGHVERAATINSPSDWHSASYYLHTQVLEIWFYDGDSGRVLTKVKLR